MAKIPKANNSITEGGDNNDSEEQKDLTAVALMLCCMKYDILDTQTAITQQKWMMKNVFHKFVCNPEIGLGVNRSILPELPPINGLNLVIQSCSKPFEKQVTPSDLTDRLSRLTMSKANVISTMLPLLNPDEDTKAGIEVTTYDSEGNEYNMEFKNWANNKYYVLTSGWKTFFHEHDFRAHEDMVTVWMFRHSETGKLCFVVTTRRFRIQEALPKRRTIKSSRKKNGGHEVATTSCSELGKRERDGGN